MPTVHNNAKYGDIAKTVIMPGDPLRAKYIAENFLTDVILVNTVRNMFAYTGSYKGTKITIMASGMGMPSMGIYCYELYKFYGVENIIRIGTCGGYSNCVSLLDLVLVTTSYSESNFALTFNNETCHYVEASSELNQIINEKSKNLNIDLITGNNLCIECFDQYINNLPDFLSRIPQNFNPLTAEMESFSLFYTAKYFGKKASCILCVVDSHYSDEIVSIEEREKNLKNMIILALESAIEI